MKIVIDIPEDRLNSIKHFGIKQNEVYMLEKALMGGTPLPKGHGRLIDEDRIAGDSSWDIADRLDATPTVIEADVGDLQLIYAEIGEKQVIRRELVKRRATLSEKIKKISDEINDLYAQEDDYEEATK